MSGTNRPHLVTIKVSQVIGIQSHPSLLIDVRSGEGDAEQQQSKGLGIREQFQDHPSPLWQSHTKLETAIPVLEKWFNKDGILVVKCLENRSNP